jgi:regulator of ribosome biosynthesis
LCFQGGQHSNVDPFEKAIEDKRERVAKNELHRLRNIAKARKVNLPGVGLAPLAPQGEISNNVSYKLQCNELKNIQGSSVTNSQDLQKAADLAKKSTASLGKFQEKLPAAMEKAVKPKGQVQRSWTPYT